MLKFGTLSFLICSLCLGWGAKANGEPGNEPGSSFCELFFLVPTSRDSKLLSERPLAYGLTLSLLREGFNASRLNRADLYALAITAENNHAGFRELIGYLKRFYQEPQVLAMLAHLDRELEHILRNEWPVATGPVSEDTLARAASLTEELKQAIESFTAATQPLPRNVDSLLGELSEQLASAEAVAADMILGGSESQASDSVLGEVFKSRLESLSLAIADGRLLYRLVEAHALYCSHDSVWPESATGLFLGMSERVAICAPSAQVVLASFSDRLPQFEYQTLQEFLLDVGRDPVLSRGRLANDIWPWAFRTRQR